MRANRTYGSEGGEASPSRPLSAGARVGAASVRDLLLLTRAQRYSLWHGVPMIHAQMAGDWC